MRDVCAAAMVAAGSGGRSRLQLPPCFLTQHPRRSACSWLVSVFSLGKGRGSTACSWPVLLWKEGEACCMQLAAHLGKRKDHPPSLLAFIPPLK